MDQKNQSTGVKTIDWARQVTDLVEGLGYEAIELQFTAGGLLRLVIDVMNESRPIQVDDCEVVNRQVGHLLNVIDLNYSRLEVSSPGLDRLLTKPVHVHRFVGETVALSLKEPIKEFARRRHFEGILVERENDSDVVVVEFTQTDGTLFEIVVRWNEIQELRLVPRLPFGAKRSIKGNRK